MELSGVELYRERPTLAAAAAIAVGCSTLLSVSDAHRAQEREVSFRLFSHKFYVLSPQFFLDHTNEACDLTMIAMMIQ